MAERPKATPALRSRPFLLSDWRICREQAAQLPRMVLCREESPPALRASAQATLDRLEREIALAGHARQALDAALRQVDAAPSRRDATPAVVACRAAVHLQETGGAELLPAGFMDVLVQQAAVDLRMAEEVRHALQGGGR